jgi:CubicO group peptidase (beta-lactamase class C family)
MSDNPKSEYPMLAEFRGLIERAVAGPPLSRGVPGAVAALGRGDTTLATCVAGQADTLRPRPMTEGTVFDIASLTKVVATTTVSLALAGAGRLAPGDPVTAYLPEAAWPAEVTIWHLLTHTSGLPGSVKFYQHCQTRAGLLAGLLRTPLEAPPGTRVVYSDLGFIALGEIVAAVAGEPLDGAVRRLVTGPLRMDATGYTPSGPPERFAATEPRGDGTAWTGAVHDENARVMGGVAGHAGLFATAADLARFAQWWVSAEDGPVPVALRREATTCQTDGLPGVAGYPGRRGLGWVCPGDRYDILGDAWPPTAVSHTGFTGTSLALDHVTGAWFVLLTNAVHFGRDATAIKALRHALHTATDPVSRTPQQRRP